LFIDGNLVFSLKDGFHNNDVSTNATSGCTDNLELPNQVLAALDADVPPFVPFTVSTM
jgi:hypothetical protein